MTPIVIAILEAMVAVVLVIASLIAFGFDPAFSFVLGAIAAATAPAATIMVIRQYRAKGPVTETLLSVVALDDAVALIGFGIAVAIAQMIENPGSGQPDDAADGSGARDSPFAGQRLRSWALSC